MNLRKRLSNGFLLTLALTVAALLPASRAVAEAVPQSGVATSLAAMPPEQRGDLLMVHKEYVAAIDAYRQAPTDAQILNKIGIAYHHLDAIDEAKKDYREALLIRPNYPEAINNLGAADFAERNYKQAIRLYRRALRLMPNSATIAANLGTAYFARGKFKRGLEAYRTAFALDPNVFNGDALQVIVGPSQVQDRARQDYCIAELFAQAGMQDRALEYLRKAFDEGFTDRNRLMQDQVFARLRKTAQFAQLMAEEKIR